MYWLKSERNRDSAVISISCDNHSVIQTQWQIVILTHKLVEHNPICCRWVGNLDVSCCDTGIIIWCTRKLSSTGAKNSLSLFWRISTSFRLGQCVQIHTIFTSFKMIGSREIKEDLARESKKMILRILTINHFKTYFYVQKFSSFKSCSFVLSEFSKSSSFRQQSQWIYNLIYGGMLTLLSSVYELTIITLFLSEDWTAQYLFVSPYSMKKYD
jgi:hypothetical protein